MNKRIERMKKEAANVRASGLWIFIIGLCLIFLYLVLR
jgi:hypothetical protein